MNHNYYQRPSSSSFAQRRRRRGAAVASILLFVSSFGSFHDGGHGGAGVEAFTSPSTKAILSHSPVAPTILHTTTTAKKSLRAVAQSSSDSDISRKSGIPAGSPLEMICKDQNEFELCVGKAMDTLRDDYPHILTKNPDYSIYDAELEVMDPSGIRLHGIRNYKAVFRLLHAIVGIFYCPERSGLTFRMCFDKARQNIRIHWNAQVIPKAIFGGYKTTLHADGISVYELDRFTGNITQHRLERLVINDNPITPEEGVFASLRGHAIKSQVDGVPVFNVDFEETDSSGDGHDLNTIFQFQRSGFLARGSVLFSDSDHDISRSSSSGGAATTLEAMSSSSSGSDSENNSNQPSQSQAMASAGFDAPLSQRDLDSLEKKNSARKKFGLKPMTPEEFLELQEQVAELDSQQKKKAAAAAAAAEMAKQQKQEDSGFFNKLFGNVLQDTCETNFDCEYPKVCCDFGFKKMCCSSGMRILDGPPQSRMGQLAEIPVPADPGPLPPDDYYRRRGRY